ncbi:MAG: hypothetical protein AB1757_16390 [Acidobacteriota bacterium]
MWVRKSEKEIENWQKLQAQKCNDKLRPFLVSLGISTASFIVYLLGYRGSFRGFIFYSESSTSGIRALIIFVFFFLIIFSIAIFNQRRYGALTPNRDSLLCQSCQTPCAYNAEQRCFCGGKLEPFGYFNWVPDESLTED